MLPRAADQRPFGRNQAFVPADRRFVQHAGAQIPVNLPRPYDAQRLEAMGPLHLRAHEMAPVPFRETERSYWPQLDQVNRTFAPNPFRYKVMAGKHLPNPGVLHV
jgi:hypothetical protein